MKQLRTSKSFDRIATVLLLAMVMSVIGVSCGGQPKVVVVDGSSTVFPITVAAQEAYGETLGTAPRITVSQSGTGGGFGKYAEGEVDIVDASRPAKPSEEESAKSKGLDWTQYIVGHDGITVVVNPENTFVEELSVAQLKEIFEPGSSIKNWSDLNPEWPEEEIILYTPDDDSGTYDFFLEALGLETQRKEGVTPSTDDNVLVRGIEGDESALGYFGFAYYIENTDRLRAIKIKADDESEAIEPTPETIYDGSYSPLSRPLFIYVKDASMALDAVDDFVTFYLENAKDLAEKVGYVGPDAEESADNQAKLTEQKSKAAAAE